jgi:hypothetical protein
MFRSTDSVKRGVEIFRSRILKHIDDMEEKLMLEVNAANSKILAETEEDMKAVEIYMSDIQDISHKFNFTTKNGSEKEIFRLINHWKPVYPKISRFGETDFIPDFSTTCLAVSIKYLTSDAKSSNMVALLTPFAATSNGFIFPHIRCSSAIYDLQQISS